MPAAPGQEGAAGPANESTSPPEGSKWQQGSDYDIIELPGKSKGAQAKAKAKGKGAGAMDREALLRGCVSLERRCFPKHEAMGDDLRDEADKHGAKLYIGQTHATKHGYIYRCRSDKGKIKCVHVRQTRATWGDMQGRAERERVWRGRAGRRDDCVVGLGF